jgi:hypothetical protein
MRIMSRSATIPETIPESGANLGRTGGRSGSFLGFPLEGFGFLTSLLLALSSGFFTFFLVTALSIFGLLVWNQMLHHRVNYADSYLFFGLPAAIAVWTVALGVFGTLWIRAKIHAR